MGWTSHKNKGRMRALCCNIVGNRSRRRQAKRWIDNMKEDVGKQTLNIEEVAHMTRDWKTWSHLISRSRFIQQMMEDTKDEEEEEEGREEKRRRSRRRSRRIRRRRRRHIGFLALFFSTLIWEMSVESEKLNAWELDWISVNSCFGKLFLSVFFAFNYFRMFSWAS